MAHIFYTACCRPSWIRELWIPRFILRELRFHDSCFLYLLLARLKLGIIKRIMSDWAFVIAQIPIYLFISSKNPSNDTLTTKAPHTSHWCSFIFTLHFIPTTLPRPHRLAARKTSEPRWFRRDLKPAPSQLAPAKRQKKRKRLHNPGVLSSRNGKSFPFT